MVIIFPVQHLIYGGSSLQKVKNNDHKKLKGGRCGEKALSIESYYGIESL